MAGASRVDRALTLGGRGRGETAELGEATKKTYTRLHKRFAAWCRAEHRRAMPATPETVALYAESLARGGYARQTALMAVTAVRWAHRVQGETPPDGVPAWYVLGEDHRTRRTIEEARVPPVRRGELLRLREACVDGTVRGLRDWALVELAYATSASHEQLAEVDIRHVTEEGGGLRVRLAPRVAAVAAGEDLAVCPVIAVKGWLATLRRVGAESGPVLRAVDRAGNVAGCGPKAGRVAESVWLRPDQLARMLRVVFVRAGLGGVARPSFALRLGGAMDARAAGASRGEIAERLGYTRESATLLDYLVEFEERGP